MPRCRRPRGALVVLALGLVSRWAAADPTPAELAAARELFAKVERDEEQLRFEEALEKLRRIRTVKETAGIRFHVAFCEDKLDRRLAALSDYAVAEEMARRDGNREVLEAVAEPLARLRALVPKLTLELPRGTSPDGVHVWLDGTAVPPATLGTPLPVDAGPHHVRATRTGHAPFESDVTLRDRENVVLDLEWPAASGASPGDTRPAPHGFGPWPYVAAGTGLVLAGVGIGAFVGAADAVRSGRADCLTDPTTCDAARGRVRALDAVALGSWVGSATAIGVAAVLFARGPRGADGSTSNVAPRVSKASVGPASFVLEGEF
ncbi:MAG: hypothetical protein U0169_25060 [Polyangiaceae bacterium]